MEGLAGRDRPELLVGGACVDDASSGVGEKSVMTCQTGQSWAGVDAVKAFSMVQRGLYVQ